MMFLLVSLTIDNLYLQTDDAAPASAPGLTADPVALAAAAGGPSHLTASTSSSSANKTENVWKATKFREQDTDEKFRKLMGIRGGPSTESEGGEEAEKLTKEQMQRQEELFSQLDREYAFARMTTHTHRGIGLGFQSQGLPP